MTENEKDNLKKWLENFVDSYWVERFADNMQRIKVEIDELDEGEVRIHLTDAYLTLNKLLNGEFNE